MKESAESLGIGVAKVEGRRLGTATEAVGLPKTKPRTVSVFLIMPAISRGEVARGQGPGVGHGEGALQPLDFVYDLLGIH